MSDPSLMPPAPAVPAVVIPDATTTQPPEPVLTREQRVEAEVRAWLNEKIHDSPISRVTDAMNHLTAALPNLVSRLLKEI